MQTTTHECASDGMATHERIKYIRKRLGIKAVDVAKELGISKGHYSSIESGKRRLTEPHLKGIAKVLRVSMAAIFGEGFSELELAAQQASPEQVTAARQVLSDQNLFARYSKIHELTKSADAAALRRLVDALL